MRYSTKSSESAPDLALESSHGRVIKGKRSTVTISTLMYAPAFHGFSGAAIVEPPATPPPLPLLQGSERKPHKLFTPADNSARGWWKELSLSLKAV